MSFQDFGLQVCACAFLFRRRRTNSYLQCGRWVTLVGTSTRSMFRQLEHLC